MKKIVASIIMALLLVPAAAMAFEKGSVELKSTVQVEVVAKDEAGQPVVKLMDIGKTKVVPGDVVVFTVSYKNVGDKPAENVVITNPIPVHLDYVDQSAGGEDATVNFSINHGKSYASPDAIVITDQQGRERDARATDYTDIRWTVNHPVAVAASGSVSFRAKVQ